MVNIKFNDIPADTTDIPTENIIPKGKKSSWKDFVAVYAIIALWFIIFLLLLKDNSIQEEFDNKKEQNQIRKSAIETIKRANESDKKSNDNLAKKGIVVSSESVFCEWK